MNLITIKNHDTKKLSLLIFSLAFIIFLFTSDGHRYTLDEALGQEMTYRMVTLEPDPAYVQGVSKNFFNLPIFNPNNVGPLCSNAITCYPSSIFYSITQVPFVAVNHFFQIITPDTLTLTTDDFIDQHYIFWRNSEKPDLVFMELFYGPFFSALSVAIFFLICLEYKFTKKTCITLSLLFAFTTIIWAYSNTSLNVVPALCFILLGYLFYKKSQTNFELKFLFFSSMCFGFSFLIREASILITLPIFAMILINVFRKKTKIIPFLCFTFTLIFSYFLRIYVSSLQLIQSDDLSGAITVYDTTKNFIPNSTSLIHMFGLLLSPGTSPLLKHSQYANTLCNDSTFSVFHETKL